MSKRVLGAALAAILAMPAAAQAATQTVTFTTAAEHTFTVPEGVTSIHVVAIGGSGASTGAGSGGTGGRLTADVPVQGGQLLYVEVGGNSGGVSGGFNGGGSGGTGMFSNGGGGGGASDIRTAARSGSQTLASRILVAPGGGGAAGAPGGDGGAAGTDGTGCAGSGGGAGQTGAGGAKGTGCTGGSDGAPGMLGAGGDGGDGTAPLDGGGGGGGGAFGGGGGGQNPASSGGGGGGSFLVGPGVVLVQEDVPSLGTAPSVSISYEAPTADASTPSAFPTTPQGTVSASHVVTLTNNGTGLLVVHGETFGQNGLNPGADDFFVGSSNCGGLIGPSGSCEIRVRFAPQAQGARSAVMHIETNAPGSPTDVTLSGTGGSLPQGPKGDKGDKGGRGPAGRDAQISCKVVKGKRLKKLKVICTLKFLNGHRVAKVSGRLVRHGRTVAAGHARRRHGRIVLRLSGRARARGGFYTLRLVTVDRHGHRRTARFRIRISSRTAG